MKLPYPYRGLVMLAALVLLLPWTVWRFALHDTVVAWHACRRLETRLSATPAYPAEKAPAAAPELILSGRLLDTVRRAAVGHDVEVTGYEPSAEAGKDDSAIHTAQVTLTGNFRALLRTLRALEDATTGCRLCALAWHSDTDRRTRRKRLMLTVYVQQLVSEP